MQQAIIVAKKMLAENLDVNLIMKITGLKKEQFMKQQKFLDKTKKLQL